MISKQRWIQVLSLTLFILGASALAYVLWKHWDTVGEGLAQLNWWLFALAVLVATLGNFLLGEVQRRMLRNRGVHMSIDKSQVLMQSAQISKYVPGKVWSILHQRLILGMPSTLMPLVLVNTDLMGLSLLVRLSMCFLLIAPGLVSVLAIVGLLIVSMALVLQYRLTDQIVALTRHTFGGEKKIVEPLPASDALTTSAIFCGTFWIIFAGGLSMALVSTGYWQLSQIPVLVGAVSLGYMVSVLAFIVPAGIGIREGIIIWSGVEFGFGAGEMTLIAGVARLWQIMQDIIGLPAWVAVARIFRLPR